MPVSEWVEKNTTLKKRPFSFKGFEFQRQIIDDMSPDLTVIKISQVGLTEIQIRKALAFLVRNRGTSLIMSLPTEDMYNRVSKARVKPIINEDKVFNTVEDKVNKSVRSTELMQLGQSFLYLVPAIESAATSISADFVMNDEVDLSDQKMISLFSSRLQASTYRISQKFGTPSFPQFGIDLNWQTSDQHLYLCHCKACGHWNHPEFNRTFIHLPGMPENIKDLTEVTADMQEELQFENAYVKCEECEKPLDLDDPAGRQWVPSYPGRRSRGYRITPFVNSKLGIEYIFKQMWEFQKTEYIRGFYNTVLGLPYSDGNIQIPVADILACMTNESMPRDLSSYKNLWVGIDVGQICHVTIGTGPNKDECDIVALYEIKVDDLVQHCKELCEKYDVVGGAIDRHPYEPTADEIFRVTGGKIVPVEYRGTKDVNVVENEYKEISHAQVNRTSFLDNLSTRIRKRSIKISGYGHRKQIFVDHLRDMVREQKPGEPAEWIKLHGNDHFFHSASFMLIAPHVRDIVILKSDSEVRTLAIASAVRIQDNTSNIAGVSPKRQNIPIGINRGNY